MQHLDIKLGESNFTILHNINYSSNGYIKKRLVRRLRLSIRFFGRVQRLVRVAPSLTRK